MEQCRQGKSAKWIRNFGKRIGSEGWARGSQFRTRRLEEIQPSAGKRRELSPGPADANYDSLMRELRKGIRLKFRNRDVAVDGNVRDSGDGPAAGRAPHVAWCLVHSRRPLKIRRTECRSRPVVLITASGLQGEQPLGSRQNGSVTSGKGLALRAGLGGPSSEPVDCWRAA
ncbi:hypothetical protein YC2023_002981 [Brassica napus]